MFPVYKMVAAVICGYRFSKNEKYYSTTGACAGNTFTGVGDPDDNQTNYIVIKYINSRTSGSNATARGAPSSSSGTPIVADALAGTSIVTRRSRPDIPTSGNFWAEWPCCPSWWETISTSAPRWATT